MPTQAIMTTGLIWFARLTRHTYLSNRLLFSTCYPYKFVALVVVLSVCCDEKLYTEYTRQSVAALNSNCSAVMEMEMEKRRSVKAHVLVLSYPATGHTNPMLQFSKNIASRGLLVTFVTFTYNHHRVIQAQESLQRLNLNIQFECIPDGLPQDHTLDSNINNVVFNHMNKIMDGSGLEQLIHRLNARGSAPPVCCIVYNPFLPWARQVAKKMNIPHALFWTQSTAVFSIYHQFNNGPTLIALRISLIYTTL